MVIVMMWGGWMSVWICVCDGVSRSSSDDCPLEAWVVSSRVIWDGRSRWKFSAVLLDNVRLVEAELGRAVVVCRRVDTKAWLNKEQADSTLRRDA